MLPCVRCPSTAALLMDSHAQCACSSWGSPSGHAHHAGHGIGPVDALVLLTVEGLKLEKLSQDARYQDFAVKASLRRSEQDEPQSLCGLQRLLSVSSPAPFRQSALHHDVQIPWQGGSSLMWHRITAALYEGQSGGRLTSAARLVPGTPAGTGKACTTGQV